MLHKLLEFFYSALLNKQNCKSIGKTSIFLINISRKFFHNIQANFAHIIDAMRHIKQIRDSTAFSATPFLTAVGSGRLLGKLLSSAKKIYS